MNIAQAILLTLTRVHPHLMPEEALRVDVSLLSPEAVSLKELGDELKKIEGKKWIVGIRDEVTGVLKWKITDEGRALKLF